MSEESEDQISANIKAIIKAIDISKTGYGGILPNGNIVDRREHPDAIPIQKNSLLGVPDVKKIQAHDLWLFWEENNYTDEQRKKSAIMHRIIVSKKED